jgi:hypothetical protein
MTSLNIRCKSAVLAAMMAGTSFFGTTQVRAEFPVKKVAVVGATLVGLATWIRLNSKGSKFDYSMENWCADVDAFLKSYNIFDAESRATLIALYDKWIVGRQFKVIDVSYRSTDENGMITTLKDKKIKSMPFGLMGLFDAYVLFQIKKINENVKELKSAVALVNDPYTTILS